MTVAPDQHHKAGVFISNKEIYEMVQKLKGQVSALTVTNGIFMTVITAVMIGAFTK